MAEVIGTFDTGHSGPVHDTQLDYYGRRLATASSDHTIRIFDVSTDQPTFLAELRGHEGPVWQVCWAHPTFGSVLVSCSYDKKVLVWKEVQRSRWEIVYSCDDFSSSINAVCWCPWDFGLQFACAISDGSIAVCSYSPETRSWTKKQVFGHPNGANSVSWAPATNSVGNTTMNSCSSQPVRLVSGGCDNQIRIWKQDPQTKELSEMNQTLDIAHSEWVRDVAWRPSVDLLAETIASCGDDKIVVIWTQDADGQGWHSSQILNFNEPVWRVSWSVTGTVLAASSGEDVVTLFRENSEGKWEVLTNISGSEQQQEKQQQEQQLQQQFISQSNNDITSVTNIPSSNQEQGGAGMGPGVGMGRVPPSSGLNAQTPSQFQMRNEDSSSPPLSVHGQNYFGRGSPPSQHNNSFQTSMPPPMPSAPSTNSSNIPPPQAVSPPQFVSNQLPQQPQKGGLLPHPPPRPSSPYIPGEYIPASSRLPNAGIIPPPPASSSSSFPTPPPLMGGGGTAVAPPPPPPPPPGIRRYPGIQ